ncbi:MAG: SMP-30/gluconolactonase/LRE family protein [bacterium]
MSKIKPEVLVDCTCETGESPLWHPIEARVYWVDIPAGHLYRHAPATGKTEIFEIGTEVGGFTIQTDGALLLFMAKGAVALWRDGKLQTVIEEIPEERDSRFNDVIADPQGRVFCGTMSSPKHPGRLYRLDTDRKITPVLEGVGTSNGMGFTAKDRLFYHTDTRTHEIRIFDYDKSTGAISTPRVFVKVTDPAGGPDGLTVDADGCVWSARWGGACLVRYDPAGQELFRIDFPATKVSCLTFGGKDYTDMFVTTAGGNDRKDNGPGAGALFHLNLGIKGVPEFFSRIQV